MFALSQGERANAGLWSDIRDSAKAWYTAYQLGDVDESNIPQMPVEYVGKVNLRLQDQIELAFDENSPGIGHLGWLGFSPEGTLLITDHIGNQALEFSRTDGHSIRSFGQQGRGPGEYGSPQNMAIDPRRRLYILDKVFGQIIRYDRQGQYIDGTRSFKGSRLLTGRAGEVFVLKTNPMKIIEIQRLDPTTWEPLYRTPLSTDKQRFISFRMSAYAHLCYSPVRHRLYYLGPNDYLVKEVDADTGQITRRFGQRPEGFIPLPERYQGIVRGSLADMEELEMTSPKSMTLINDRYLFVSHRHQTFEVERASSQLRWVLYDLNSTANMEAYAFSRAAVEALESFTNIIPWNSIATWQGHLYMWREPSDERADTSNGTIETYALSFETN